MSAPCTLQNNEVVDRDSAEGSDPCASLEQGSLFQFEFPAPAPPVPEVPVEPIPAPAPVVPAAPVEPATLTATTAPAPVAPTASDLGALAQQGGGGMTGIVLAVIAVAGGGAAMKFYSQRSEQSHELAKEKLKMEQAAQGLNGVQPPPCQAANTAIEQRLAALTARVEAAEAKAAAAEKKTLSLGGEFDPEDVERRIKRVERQIKALNEEK